MEPLVIEKNLEHWEIPMSDVYPQPVNIVPAETVVDGSAVTLSFGNLEPNCRYVVVITPELKGQDGSCADLEIYYFTSTYFPLYCTYQSVLSEVTVFAEYLTPHLIYQAIHNASMYADMLTCQEAAGTGMAMTGYVRPLPIPIEVAEYTKYRAAYMLVLQMSKWKAFLSGETKELNDFTITYERNFLSGILQYLYQQMEYWRVAMVGWPQSRWAVKHGMMAPAGLPIPDWVRKPLCGKAEWKRGQFAGSWKRI